MPIPAAYCGIPLTRTPNIREYEYATQRHFAVKAMAAHIHTQYSELSGSFQSGGGPQFIGSTIGSIYLNSMFSDVSNEDRRIQYVACIGWPFLRLKQVISLLERKQVLLYRSPLGRNQALVEFSPGVKPF